MEDTDMKSSIDSKPQIGYICFIRIPSRNRDIIEKPVQLIQNPYVNAKTHPSRTAQIVDMSGGKYTHKSLHSDCHFRKSFVKINIDTILNKFNVFVPPITR